MCKEGAINNKFVRLKKQNLYLNSILAVIYLTKLISSYVKLFVSDCPRSHVRRGLCVVWTTAKSVCRSYYELLRTMTSI
jgi:hypothetical protein